MRRALGVIAFLLIPVATGQACSRMRPFTLDELFNNAEIIVRATAVKYAKPPDDPRIMTTGVPDATIEFRVEEKLKGGDVPNSIILNGYLSDKDDFNEMPIPYMFVRPLGRRGSCFANTYKEGAQFLLFLKKTGDLYTPNISALGPTNEQLHSDADAWLGWVRDHLTAEKANESAVGMNWVPWSLSFLLFC
jgi:hypothetical protein